MSGRPSETGAWALAYGLYLAALATEAHLGFGAGWLVPAAALGPLIWLLARDRRPAVPDELGLGLGRPRRAFVALLLCAALGFPAFYAGTQLWPALLGDGPPGALSLPAAIYQQLVQVALLEEAFFRGYLQSRMDLALGRPRRLLGAEVGWGLPLAAALFAAAHLVAQPHPLRLAVFFPGLVFGWLRGYTGSIWPAVVFHAACNLYLETLTGRIALG